MPEGYSSIADLQIVIDASTQGLSDGLRGVQGILDQFGAQGNSTLGGLDRIITGIGGTALSVASKFNVWLTALESGIALYQEYAGLAQQYAEEAGFGAEFAEAKAAADTFGQTVEGVVLSTVNALTGATGDASVEIDAFRASLYEAGQQGEETAGILDRLRVGVFEALAGGLNATTDLLRALGPQTAATSEEMSESLSRVAERLDDAKAALDGLSEGGIAFTFMSQSVRILEEQLERLNAQLVGGAFARLKADMASPTFGLPEFETTTRTSLLDAEIEAQRRKIATLGMSAAETARYNAVLRATEEAERRGIEMSPEIIAAIESEAAEIARLTQRQEDHAKSVKASAEAEQKARADRQREEQRERSGANILAGAEREIANLEARTNAMTMGAAAAGEMAMRERLLNQLRSQGLPLDEARLVQVRALSEEYRRALEVNEAVQDGMERMRDVTMAISRQLEGAFRGWMQGVEQDSNALISALLEDLAMLTLRRGVLDPLSEGLSGGFGVILQGLLGGARADGGPVAAGVPYLVGERGPEIVVPNAGGQVIPNHALGGGAGLSLTVNAPNSTPDSVERLKADLPGLVLNTIREARERGLS